MYLLNFRRENYQVISFNVIVHHTIIYIQENTNEKLSYACKGIRLVPNDT